MAAMRFTISVLVLFLICTVFALGEQILDSQLVLLPANENGTVLNATVLVFEPAVSTSGTDIRALMQQIAEECAVSSPNDIQGCIYTRSVERTAASRNYSLNLTSLNGAHLRFEYYNTVTNEFTIVQGCEDKTAADAQIAYRASPSGDSVPVTYYLAQCIIPQSLYSGQPRTTIRVVFVPQPGQQINGKDIRGSMAEYQISTTRVSPAATLTRQLTDLIRGVAQGVGYGGAVLPCFGVFMIVGLLLASLYFSGKSPISLLDITTPKLPTPKGVVASGQILAPFGYTEMKDAARRKLKAAADAIKHAHDVWIMPGDAGYETLKSQLNKLKVGAADKAAGDAEQGRTVARSLIAAGRYVGMSAAELAALVNTLPYHYKDAEHKIVSQILQKLEAKGGADAIRAMALKDYLLGLRTFQSLEVLTAHPDIGQRSAMHYRLTSTLGKMFGANRYAVLGPVVMAGTDSTFRTARIMGRMTKAIATQSPALARGIARTTMEMIGGRRAIENLEAKAKVSPVAAWAYGQLTKHPSQIVLGQMFPVNDKMAHLYKVLREETLRDEMRYVLRQIYKKMGVRFDVSEHELAEMGHTDVDILKRSGLTPSADLTAVEERIKHIITNSTMSSYDKLNALRDIATSHGAHIDHREINVARKLEDIERSAEPEYMKLIRVQQVISEEGKTNMAVRGGSRHADDAYLCHVGGESLRGNQVWETMVLRTMIWDAENGYLRGGIREELVSARLNVVNRLVSLDPTSAMEQLPEHMRNPAQLKAVAERNKSDLISLFSEDGRRLFEQTSKKSITSASISDIVGFMYGGVTPKSMHVDEKTGKMFWWGSDQELSLPKNATLVDVKRHWVTGLDPRENFAVGQWVESRFTRSYVSPHKASIEAELDRMAGSAAWTPEQRTQAAKKLWVSDQMMQDMEQRFNSHFNQNTYGTTHETTRFYGGVLAGFLEKALRDKGIEPNHPDLRFLDHMDMNNPKHLSELNQLMLKYRHEFEEILKKPVTYDDVAKTNKAMVMLHEGGFAYYHKGMMLSDMDRVMGGEVALRDNKGQLRHFAPEDVPMKFPGRDDLWQEFNRVRSSKDQKEWTQFLEGAKVWTKEGGYNYEKEKVFAAVLWEYSQKTHDYARFWKESAVSVEPKREVTPLAPSILRYFGVDAPALGTMMKPIRDIGMHFGDYISKVSLIAGGSVHKTSYDITPVSEYYRQHSFQLATKIMSGEGLKGLTDAERVAYRNVAIQHGAFHQVWDYAIDRNPWRTSTSYGTNQAWASFFQFGPSTTFPVRENLRAYLDRGQYANFMGLYGWPMDLAGKMLRPYQSMIRGIQMSMQGYASKWDSTDDALRQWNHTEPRILEAMQALNPFSFKWFPGKTSERLAKLNIFGGSLERHQLGGREFLGGLRQAPQDIFLQRKGVYASARTGEANPGASFYNYRFELQLDAPMAEYLYRTRAQNATFMYDQRVRESAMTNTVRRTVSAEALAIRRDQEIRGFGIMQNSLFGWANPLAFLWHMPVPGIPSSITPKDIVAKWVARSKHGYGGSFSDQMKGMAQGLARGTSRLVQPHKTHMVGYCPKCGMSGYKGTLCRNPSCRQVLY